jgi:response regulator RpfG family c-di-GMP phosphodiesterase
MRVLLVEGNPADAGLLLEYLHRDRDDGDAVMHVSRLSEGIEYLSIHPVDVILLDLNLPDSQGLDTFYRLHELAADLPVVLLTNVQDEFIIKEAIQAGVRDYLNKSEINPAFLMRTLQNVIKHQYEQQLATALSELYGPLISPHAMLADIAQEVLRWACQLTSSSIGFITAILADRNDAARILANIIEENGQFHLKQELCGMEIAYDKRGRFWNLILNTRQAHFGDCPEDWDGTLGQWFEHQTVKQYLVVPVLLGERLGGQIALLNPLSKYSEQDLAAIRRLAEFYGMAIQRWEAENALRQARDESQRLFRAEREQRELAETMHDMVSLLVSAPDQETIFQRLLEQVGRVVPFDEAVIFLIDGERINAIHRAGYQHFHPQNSEIKPNYRIDDVPNLRYMFETGLPVVNPDTYNHPNWIVLPDTAHIRSYAGVPIRVKKQVIGFLNVHSTVPGLYNQTYLERLAIFGDEVAIGLENARLLEETRHRLADLETINKVSASLRAAETLEGMLPAFMDGLLEVIGTDSGAIFLMDPVSNVLNLTIRRGLYESFSIPPLQSGEGIVGRVFQNGKTYFFSKFHPDLSADFPVVAPKPSEISGLYLPLRTAQEMFGVVALAFRAARQPTTDEIHLVETLADIAGNTFHRMRLYEETETRLQYLSALRTIDLAIATSFDLRVTLNVLLDQTLIQLNVDAADILLCIPVLQTLEYAAGRGFQTRAIEQAHMQIGQGFAGQAALEGQMIFLPDLRDRKISLGRFEYLTSENFITYIGVPLIIKGEVKGVLELYSRSLFQPSNEWRDFLDALSRQAAIAIDNAQLFENLQRSQLELAMAYDYTLEGWSRALDMRDKETEGHTQRVTEMTVRLTRRNGFNDIELVHARRGAILHDIGKMGVPDHILLKPGPLTLEERKVIELHPTFAMELLSPIAYLRPALDIPYYHHERWDGTGYPRGLKGEQIPKAARIFAIIDVWDALSHDRIYKKAWPRETILAHLREESGKHFDPEVVIDFINMLEEEAEEKEINA